MFQEHCFFISKSVLSLSKLWKFKMHTSKKSCCKQISLNQYFWSFNVLFISFFFGLTSFFWFFISFWFNFIHSTSNIPWKYSKRLFCPQKKKINILQPSIYHFLQHGSNLSIQYLRPKTNFLLQISWYPYHPLYLCLKRWNMFSFVT